MIPDIDPYKEYLQELSEAKTTTSLTMLAQMVEKVSDLIQQSIQDKKTFYDEQLGKTITDALGKVSESLKNSRSIDLTPITKTNEVLSKSHKALVELIEEITNQNKKIMLALSQKSVDVSKYDTMLTSSMTMISRTNEFLNKSLKVVDYSKELGAITESLKRPTKWEHVLHRESDNRVHRIISTAID